MNEHKTSQLSKFYRKTLDERQGIILDWAQLEPDDIEALSGNGLSLEQANHMIENVVGLYALPFGIATNFLINNKDYLIPMVVEEPSVVAAVSNAAKVIRASGGFESRSDDPIMIGQIQLLDIEDVKVAEQAIKSHQDELLAEANSIGGSIVKRGGGARALEIRAFQNTAVGNMLVIHLLYDAREAMGANAINTAVEHIAPQIEMITGGRVNLRILSNLTDKRKAYASCRIPADLLATDAISGQDAVRYIVEAGVFAEVDPYRATTHNKGVMNGIDAVLIATGNDWRAVEAGAHAYTARDGAYTSMTRWWQDEQGDLCGYIEIPLAVGTVGGATRVHPVAQVAMKILGHPSAQELSEIIACVGLAQNLAAIRALATVGIQQGHMRMHARQLAIAAGASGEQVMQIVQSMIDERSIRLETAKRLLNAINGDE
jgi:hydroxymethylglutaryl-CoA reductase